VTTHLAEIKDRYAIQERDLFVIILAEAEEKFLCFTLVDGGDGTAPSSSSY